MQWNKAQGRVVKGLTNRRVAERKLCLEGINEPAPKPIEKPAALSVWDKIKLFFRSIWKAKD